MRLKNSLPLLWLSLAATSFASLQASSAFAQTAATAGKPGQSAPASSGDSDAQSTNRAQAYFHAAMANLYEEQAVNSGKPEYVQHAIEEYKAAINRSEEHTSELQSLRHLVCRL